MTPRVCNVATFFLPRTLLSCFQRSQAYSPSAASASQVTRNLAGESRCTPSTSRFGGGSCVGVTVTSVRVHPFPSPIQLKCPPAGRYSTKTCPDIDVIASYIASVCRLADVHKLPHTEPKRETLIQVGLSSSPSLPSSHPLCLPLYTHMHVRECLLCMAE